MLTPDNLVSFVNGIRSAKSPRDLTRLGAQFRIKAADFALDALACLVGLGGCALGQSPMDLMRALTGRSIVERYLESDGLAIAARFTLEIIADPTEIAGIRAAVAATGATKRDAH